MQVDCASTVQFSTVAESLALMQHGRKLLRIASILYLGVRTNEKEQNEKNPHIYLSLKFYHFKYII